MANPVKQPTSSGLTLLLGRKVKYLEVQVPPEILGNRKTFSSGGAEMIVCAEGISIISKKTKDQAVIAHGNVKAYILLPEASK